jgi:hypothetical protein
MMVRSDPSSGAAHPHSSRLIRRSREGGNPAAIGLRSSKLDPRLRGDDGVYFVCSNKLLVAVALKVSP